MRDGSKTTINVTQRHIDNGICLAPCRCPVALAFMDEGIEAGVTPFRLWIGKKSINMPQNASRFVVAFDRGDPVQPFSFEIEL